MIWWFLDCKQGYTKKKKKKSVLRLCLRPPWVCVPGRGISFASCSAFIGIFWQISNAMWNLPLPFWSSNTLLEGLHISTHPFDLIQSVLHSNFLGWFQLASCSLLPVLFLTVIHRVLLEKSALCHDAALLKIYCLCAAFCLLGLSSEMPAMFLPMDYP